MSTSKIGFVVIYRWRLRIGKEEQFQKGWETITRALLQERGALGSRLHQAEDGTWFAYAQWPAKKVWEHSRELGPLDPAASAAMAEATEESFEPVLMTPVCDHLLSG